MPACSQPPLLLPARIPAAAARLLVYPLLLPLSWLGHRYPVQAGDAIWMSPYVPQWYAALGKQPSRYIIYKDTILDPLFTSV